MASYTYTASGALTLGASVSNSISYVEAYSETAKTLIKASLRSIGAIATGETPTNAEVQDGLEALQFMVRNWSATDIRLYYTKQESLTMDGSTYYTVGRGGDLNTVRPASIRGAWTDDNPVKLITEDRYRQVRMSASSSGNVEYLWYSPESPLARVYPWPKGSGTLYLDTLKPIEDPTSDLDDVSLPPEYFEAIVYNLAIRLAPQYGLAVPIEVVALAKESLGAIESRNFAWQMNTVRPEIIKLAHARYNIEND